MCQYIPIHASHRAPMQSPLPHHLTLALSSCLDPRCMAVCIRMLPRRNAFWVSRHLCSLALWFASEVCLCRHRICLCSSSVDMLLRQALPFRPFFFLALKHILPAIPAITVTIIYASHRSKHVLPVSLLCRSYYTSCSITCSFPAIPIFRYPHCDCLFFFPLSFLHLQSIEGVLHTREP